MKKPVQDTKTVVGAIDPDVLAFTVGKDPILDRRLAQWDCYGTAAHVTMLTAMQVEPRIFSAEERDAVLAQLAILRDRARAGQFEITEADQDCHLAIERNLTEALGTLGRRVHTGRSRNDQVAVAVRLFTRHELLGTQDEILALAEALIAFAREHRALPMVGRTHLQPAMPSSVGVWASAYGEELLDTLGIVRAAYDYVNKCPLGSAASYGVPLPIDRALTARLLGFRAPIHNVLAAGNARGKMESIVISACEQVMLTLSRLAQDLILFSMPEFGYFSIPKEFCTGSSIMPQKYNPDVCELIRSKAAQVCALAGGAASIVEAMPGGYNRDLQDTKALLMEALDVTRASLRILSRLVSGLQPHPDRLRDAFKDPGVFATDRALELVAAGMPFRDAYHQVRDHLEELRGMNPDETIAKKTHAGAPFGLDFDLYAHRIAEEKAAVRTLDEAASRPLAELLGA